MSENEQPNLRGDDPERRKDAFADDADVEGHTFREGPAGFYAEEGQPGLASAKDDEGDDVEGHLALGQEGAPSVSLEGPEGGPGFIASAKDDEGDDVEGHTYLYEGAPSVQLEGPEGGPGFATAKDDDGDDV